MEAMEEEGRSEMEFTEIETRADCLDSSVIFHVVADILGFVLYMHQQIPSILQDMSLEFETLQTEYKELEIFLAQNEFKASLRRKHAGRMREVKQGIRRVEKVMKTIYSLRAALQLMISEIPDIHGVILVLGASPIRPQHVYEVCFSHGKVVSGGNVDFAKSRAAEGLSRKAIRTLISKGAGSDSYAGPTKLFLLVKAPSSFNLPLHFLPKRDFRYSKKIVPFRLRFKCRTQDLETDAQHCVAQTAESVSLMDSTSNDLIWVLFGQSPEIPVSSLGCTNLFQKSMALNAYCLGFNVDIQLKAWHPRRLRQKSEHGGDFSIGLDVVGFCQSSRTKLEVNLACRANVHSSSPSSCHDDSCFRFSGWLSHIALDIIIFN